MERPEIVIGLVGPLGANLGAVVQALQRSLDELGYGYSSVRLSELLEQYEHPAPFDINILRNYPSESERISRLMTAGTQLRKAMERGDALAIAAVTAIRAARFRKHSQGINLQSLTEEERKKNAKEYSETPIANHAFILWSLKHGDEVETLRKIYGPSFFLISAYAPRQDRLANLTKRITDSLSQFRPEGHEGEALSLLERDEAEDGEEYGQQVRKTFWRGDVYVDSSKSITLEQSIKRVVQLWFSYPFHTPTRDEYMMFSARSAAYRSASMGRQVGATISTPDGSIVSTGTNEVPKAGGGSYWYNDDDDGRDHMLESDSSDKMRKELLTDILNRLHKLRLLTSEPNKSVKQLVDDLLYGSNPVMEAAEFQSLTEFQRPVHAEMSAITDAARRGVALQGTTLYATTYPCHGCARHIVASGITRVVYIEPYAKSLAKVLHSDSISFDESCISGSKVVFEPFVGLAPRRYLELFEMGKRKDHRGNAIAWKPLEAQPRLNGWENRVSVFNEQKYVTIQQQWQQQYAEDYVSSIERKTVEESSSEGKNLEVDNGGNS